MKRKFQSSSEQEIIKAVQSLILNDTSSPLTSSSTSLPTSTKGDRVLKKLKTLSSPVLDSRQQKGNTMDNRSMNSRQQKGNTMDSRSMNSRPQQVNTLSPIEEKYMRMNRDFLKSKTTQEKKQYQKARAAREEYYGKKKNDSLMKFLYFL